jgi:hypothetical protein
MAHWLPGDELGVRTEVAPLSSRQQARVTEWTRQVHDRLLGTHLDRLVLAHTDRTLSPDESLDTARITGRLDHLQYRRLRHHPRPRPPTMTLPPVPRRRPDLVPRGSPTVVPDPQTQRAHPCRCPCVYCTRVPLASAPVHLRGPAVTLPTSTFAVPPAGLEPAAYRLGDRDRASTQSAPVR